MMVWFGSIDLLSEMPYTEYLFLGVLKAYKQAMGKIIFHLNLILNIFIHLQMDNLDLFTPWYCTAGCLTSCSDHKPILKRFITVGFVINLHKKKMSCLTFFCVFSVCMCICVCVCVQSKIWTSLFSTF